jgi:hypothetical protein
MGLSNQEPFKIVWPRLSSSHLCLKSQKELIILKLDFEKYFDRIEHQTMLQLMEHRGFNSKWLQWMTTIFSSGTSGTS